MKFGGRVIKGWEVTAVGYTGVWAIRRTGLGRHESGFL